MLIGLLTLVVALGFGAATALADDDGVTIQAQVREQQRDEDGRTDNQPVEGVTIRVFDVDGNLVNEGQTGDDGNAVVAVPGRADYVVELDESTLPDDTAVAENSAAVQEVGEESFRTDRRIVNFFTGESQRVERGLVDRAAQRLADGIRFGLILAMCSVGLSLIFGTTGLTNFAHGELVTFGGMMGYLLNVTGIGILAAIPWIVDDQGRMHLFIAAPLAVAIGAAFGWLLDWSLFSKLRKRGVGLISQMVITVGLSIALKNAIQFQFGGSVRFMRDFQQQESMNWGPVQITQRQVAITLLSLVVLLVVAYLLMFTRLGKATRAVSDNPDLASATGIDSAFVIRLVWALAGALAALGGVLLGTELGVSWDMGARLLFLMFAAITLGGLGSALGALVGGFVVGVAVEMASLVVPTELKNTPALLILILVLLFRPEGVLGKAQRVG
ncbi:MAG: branched-chain amino acid ABC transporter permease [Nocardiopsis sp. BM-2018]|nr:MAG: branched-chain amino acid ABC transporter permease [Nocardiopsis sp. BM-2018]